MSADAYLSARAAFDRADTSITQLSGRIGRVAAALMNERGFFTFSNVEGSGFPPEVIMSRSAVSDDGNTWPSAKTINLALMDWHKAKQTMDMAWAGIPQDQRAGLVQPQTRR